MADVACTPLRERALIPEPPREGHRTAAADPFLKWPGGKRWLVPHLLELIDGCKFKRYFEPFAGGAALFFALRPSAAILSDVNVDLINTYRQVKYHAREIVEHLKRLPIDKATYLRIRADEPSARIDRAVRFLYLNRTALGGIYRLNLQGQFNVPFGGGGRSPSILWEKDLLRHAAQALRRTNLIAGDFQEVLREARAGDLVCCDPTYTVSHSNNGFIRYNESNFRWEDQKRLADLCRELRGRGVTVLVSSAAHHAVAAVFDRCEVHTFSRPSTVCPKPDGRRIVQEHIFLYSAENGAFRDSARRQCNAPATLPDLCLLRVHPRPQNLSAANLQTLFPYPSTTYKKSPLKPYPLHASFPPGDYTNGNRPPNRS
jgi:DNA adenine methylase